MPCLPGIATDVSLGLAEYLLLSSRGQAGGADPLDARGPLSVHGPVHGPQRDHGEETERAHDHHTDRYPGPPRGPAVLDEPATQRHRSAHRSPDDDAEDSGEGSDEGDPGPDAGAPDRACQS